MNVFHLCNAFSYRAARNLWRKRYGVECLYCNETEGPFHTKTEAAHAVQLLETVHCHRRPKEE